MREAKGCGSGGGSDCNRSCISLAWPDSIFRISIPPTQMTKRGGVWPRETNHVYDIPAEFGTEFEAAEKCSHASLMTYYNDIHREMAAFYSCVNGCVFHS